MDDVLFHHNCDKSIVRFDEFRSVFIDSDMSHKHINLIWDFYVARSPSESSGLSVSLKNYGWWDITRKGEKPPNGNLQQLEMELLDAADIPKDRCAIIRRNTINKTYKSLGLADEGCICCPRIALTQNYSIEISETEKITYGSKESRMMCLFRHLRNALAHGNIYLFDNDFIMLEDKVENGKTVTARILIHRMSLIKWVFLVDSRETTYTKKDYL